jgi:hypothetical protein
MVSLWNILSLAVRPMIENYIPRNCPHGKLRSIRRASHSLQRGEAVDA